MLYLFVFLAKLFEVSLATMRLVLINRGEKLKGSMIGFIEILIWAILASNVLSDLSKDPLKLVIYCLAFSCGNYLGVTLENKLAIGMAQIQVVVSPDKTIAITTALREKGFGVTTVAGQGMDGAVDILMIFVRRKSVPEGLATIKDFSPQAVVTINDVRQRRNGYLMK
jgi:Uncharacterized protein conserved in bacteria